jgi:hypothetical protein
MQQHAVLRDVQRDLTEQRRERDQRWGVRDLVHAGPHPRAPRHITELPVAETDEPITVH